MAKRSAREAHEIQWPTDGGLGDVIPINFDTVVFDRTVAEGMKRYFQARWNRNLLVDENLQFPLDNHHHRTHRNPSTATTVFATMVATLGDGM